MRFADILPASYFQTRLKTPPRHRVTKKTRLFQYRLNILCDLRGFVVDDLAKLRTNSTRSLKLETRQNKLDSKLETRNSKLYSSDAWGSSSVWQSAAFAMRRSGVRSPSAPPLTLIVSTTYRCRTSFQCDAEVRGSNPSAPPITLIVSMTYRCRTSFQCNAEVRGSNPLRFTNGIKHLRQTACPLFLVFGVFGVRLT